MDLLTVTSFSSSLSSSGRAMFKSSILKIVFLENTPASIIIMGSMYEKLSILWFFFILSLYCIKINFFNFAIFPINVNWLLLLLSFCYVNNLVGFLFVVFEKITFHKCQKYYQMMLAFDTFFEATSSISSY